MTLHIDHFRPANAEVTARPLLLIHGWGMHGGIWRNIAEQLAKTRCVMSVDLPGHGYSSAENVGATVDIDSVVDALAGQITGPLDLCGWSLGGQIALSWALRHPDQIRRLILVATTPRFVQDAGWQCAMAAETLAEFDAALTNNYAQTLRRFLALQVRGSEREREMLAGLRGELFSRGEPDVAALHGGLGILRDCDLRGVLSKVDRPTLVIAGERDTLTPAQASQFMFDQIPNVNLITITRAAHAPFLSHPGQFLEVVAKFLNE